MTHFFIKINVYTDDPLILEFVKGEYIATMHYWSIIDVLKNILKAFTLHGITQLGSALWFVAALMEISVAYCVIDFILNKIFKHNNRKVLVAQLLVSVIFLMFGTHCFKTGRFLAGLNRVFSYYILFYGGYIVKIFRISSKDRSNVEHIVILCSTFAILLICNKFGKIALNRNSYEDPIFLLIVSFAGWQFLYEISCFARKFHWIKRVLLCMGRNTLAVVILHFLSFKIVSYIGVLLYDQPLCLVAAFPVLYHGGCWWVAYSFAGLSIPILLSVEYKKLKSKRLNQK